MYFEWSPYGQIGAIHDISDTGHPLYIHDDTVFDSVYDVNW